MSNQLGFNHNLLGSSKSHGSLLGLHTLYMLSSRVQRAPLHSCCYSWWSSLILASPKHCDLCQKFGSTFSSNLCEALLVVLGLKFYAWPLQTNAFNYLWGWIFTNGLSWPLTVSKLSYSQRPLYDFQTSTICLNITLACSTLRMRYSLSCFQTQFWYAIREYLPEDLASTLLVSSAPVDQHQVSVQAKVSLFSWTWHKFYMVIYIYVCMYNDYLSRTTEYQSQHSFRVQSKTSVTSESFLGNGIWGAE